MQITEQSAYEWIGGDARVRELVDHFYQHMDTLEEARHIRQMHPENLTLAKDKLYRFLSGWLGGPQLYMQTYGHPRLRARHLPFPITAADRDAWLLCMQKAMDDMQLSGPWRKQLDDSFFNTANFMRNQDFDPMTSDLQNRPNRA